MDEEIRRALGRISKDLSTVRKAKLASYKRSREIEVKERSKKETDDRKRKRELEIALDEHDRKEMKDQKRMNSQLNALFSERIVDGLFSGDDFADFDDDFNDDFEPAVRDEYSPGGDYPEVKLDESNEYDKYGDRSNVASDDDDDDDDDDICLD